jgi:hypothetical protein
MRQAIGLAVMAIVAVGCAAVVAEAPVVVSGTLVDGTGQPAPNAQVTLDVFDDRNLQPGQVVPTVLHVETTSDADGRFEFRFPPTQELRAFVGANAGFVNFSLTALDRDRGLIWGWSFPREIGLEGWVDEATPVRLLAVGQSS